MSKSDTTSQLKSMFDEVHKAILKAQEDINKSSRDAANASAASVSEKLVSEVQKLTLEIQELSARLSVMEKISAEKKKQVKTEKAPTKETVAAPEEPKKASTKEATKVAKTSATFFKELFTTDADFKKKVLTEEVQALINGNPEYTKKKTPAAKNVAAATIAHNYIMNNANLAQCKGVRDEFEARLKEATGKPAQLEVEPHTP